MVEYIGPFSNNNIAGSSFVSNTTEVFPQNDFGRLGKGMSREKTTGNVDGQTVG